MKDLRLWQILRAGDWQKDELLSLLTEANALPLSRRFIFLPACRTLLRDDDARVRRAAVELLREATGLQSVCESVLALSDDDTGVSNAALKNVAVIGATEPTIWAHAVFHGKLDVRRRAIESIVEQKSTARSLLVYLLADLELREEITEAVLTKAIDSLDYPLLTNLQASGVISVDELVRLLTSAKQYPISEMIQDGPAYSERDMELIAEGLDPWTEDPLQWILNLAATCDDRLRDDLVEVFFQSILTLTPVIGFATRLSSALSHVGRTTGWWNSRLIGISAAFGGSELLLKRDIPYTIRRDSIHVLYTLGTRCRHAFPAIFKQLLVSDLCRPADVRPADVRPADVRPDDVRPDDVRLDDVRLDLWSAGGLLFLCGSDPYCEIQKAYSISELRAAFWEDPRESVHLFSNPSSNQSRVELLYELTKGRQAGIVYALLIQTISADGLEFLEAIDADTVDEVIGELMQFADRAELKMSDTKLRVVSEYFSKHLEPDSLLSLVNQWLGYESPERLRLGVEVLTNVARNWPAVELITVVLRLPDEQLLRLVRVVPHCAGFPYGTELQLATALADYDHPELREWADVRLKVDSPPTRTTRTRTVDDDVPRVERELAAQIGSCADDELEDFLEPCLLRPHRGLCEALGVRTARRKWDAVCLAFIVAHDPIEEVQDLWHRFGANTRHYIEQFDLKMVDQWLHRSSLSVLGNAWLYRWEYHAFLFGDQVLVDDKCAAEWLQVGLSLETKFLGRQIWQATKRVFSLWRYRDKHSLKRVVATALIDPLVAGLSSHLGDVSAAIWIELLKSEMASEILEQARPAVVELLPFLEVDVRTALQPWIDTRGMSKTLVKRSVRSTTTGQLSRRIARSIDFDELEKWCRDADPAIASDAVLRLLELSNPGVRRLVIVLGEPIAVPCAAILADTLGLWEEEHLPLARELVVDARIPTAIRFLLALNLAELDYAADRTFDRVTLLGLVQQPAEENWFLPADLSRLMKVGMAFGAIADALATSPHPFAYRYALTYLFAGANKASDPPQDRVHQRCRDFLDCGDDREHEWRIRAAEWLDAKGDDFGFPLLFQRLSDKRDLKIVAKAADAQWCVDAILLAGESTVAETSALDLLMTSGDGDGRFRDACTQVLTDARSPAVSKAAAVSLRIGTERSRKLRRVAETFHWGVKIGRELTGRIMTVEMIGGGDLGYTRLTQNRIFINPIPLLKNTKNGRDVVEALILHEYGHHMYHRGDVEEKIWEKAQNDGVGKLLNLVTDEHLERNLRAMDSGFGDRLKRLAAYAFQHEDRELNLNSLLSSLQARSWEVLTGCGMSVSREPGQIRISNGRVMQAMERLGSSFSRFFRALRMGLGNRHNDPKVGEALQLFRHKFRTSSMEELLEITYKLREIFGHECDFLETFGQDQIVQGDAEDSLIHGAGITNEELQSEILRIDDPEGQGTTGGDGERRRWINISEDEDFARINTVVRLPSHRAAHAKLSELVAREARQFRQYLIDLGVTMQAERRRLRGRRLDRSSMQNLILKSDPRILIAREPRYMTDVFMAVIIDCSGSMEFNDNIGKAKLFAAMLADACRGLTGVDLRLFGFTDSVIYDAGDANRPAIAPLRSEGGNNDAAALLHAAQIAQQSKRRAKVLVMISDGLPTECSAAALRSLVVRITRKYQMCCAQVAVQPLEEICFPYFTLLDHNDVMQSVRSFGTTVARLVRKALGR